MRENDELLGHTMLLIVPPAAIGVSGRGLFAIAAFVAPRSECPHATIFATLRTSTE